MRPAMIETTTVAAPTNGASVGIDLGRDLRLDRDHDGGDLADRVPGRIEAQAALRQRGQVAAPAAARSRRRCSGVEPERQPAFQHGAAHLAGADQDEWFRTDRRAVRALWRARNRCCHGRARRHHPANATDAVSAALAIGKWCGAAGYRPARRSPRDSAAATPALRSRTWRRRAPRAPSCRPRPRTGRPGNSARRRRARWPAAPRIAGRRPRRRRPAPARGGT